MGRLFVHQYSSIVENMLSKFLPSRCCPFEIDEDRREVGPRMFEIGMCTVQLILLSVIEKEDRCPPRPSLRHGKVFCHLEQSDDAHTVVRRARRSGYRVVMTGKKDTVWPGFRRRKRRVRAIYLEQHVRAFEIDGMILGCYIRHIGRQVIRDMDVGMSIRKGLKSREYVLSDIVIGVRYVWMWASGYLSFSVSFKALKEL